MCEKQDDLEAWLDDMSQAVMHETEDAITSLDVHLPKFADDLTLGEIKEAAIDCWGTML